ncbi:crcB-like protein, camphor resistance (CrcB) domain-containing protein [Sarocladium implicatum]|nr:crcB-like protein, camphor resistance (CrcB) domain-containing protein [Sarocladium implicatum]
MTQPHQSTSPALGIHGPAENHREPNTSQEGHQKHVKNTSIDHESQQSIHKPSSPQNAHHGQLKTDAQAPRQDTPEEPVTRQQASSSAAYARSPSPLRRRSSTQRAGHQVSRDREDAHELGPSVQVNPTSGHRPGLEEGHHADAIWPDTEQNVREHGNELHNHGEKEPVVSAVATQLYTLSHLVFFSILGTLARIGLTALTTYPGSPVIFETIWANVGGSFIMGYLVEDSKLFRQEWGSSSVGSGDDSKRDRRTSSDSAIKAAKKAHLAVKKTIPLYVGLATGFCGSMTSFSTFARDAFLALSNDMVVPGAPQLPVSRSGGYSFMAMLAVIITTVGLSLCGLIAGSHFAQAIEPYTPSLPFRLTRRYLDPLVVFLGWGSWLGAVLLSILPPRDYWRERATFALVFAPLGCLLRFYLAMFLNSKRPSFPLGTFAANILGTAILGMGWDIAHAQIGGVVGCQVLQGIEDGFCGCLTTISTWVAELSTLRRRHAYMYGVASVVIALALLIVIMGGLRWTHGFDALLCG